MLSTRIWFAVLWLLILWRQPKAASNRMYNLKGSDDILVMVLIQSLDLLQ